MPPPSQGPAASPLHLASPRQLAEVGVVPAAACETEGIPQLCREDLLGTPSSTVPCNASYYKMEHRRRILHAPTRRIGRLDSIGDRGTSVCPRAA